MVRNVAVGVALTPFAATAATLAAANFAAQNVITGVRSLREIADESDGDCFMVYYPLGHGGGAAADALIPEIVGVDLIAGALNLKMQHCVAWFTTSSSRYVTIEITHGRSSNVVKEKR